MYKYTITIFTPTYNRAYIIDNLYQSLRRQTYKDFEWVLFDDGSEDNTEELVKKWICQENFFPITYVKGKNGGKCRAINRGLELAQGEMFFVVDSDDYLTDDACEKIVSWMNSIRDLPEFCGVAGNRGQTPTETQNTIWRTDPNTPWYNKPYRDATFLERYPEVSEYPLDGERAEVFWTDVYKKYPYPEFEGENFISEGVSYQRMAHDGYKVRYFEDIIWIWEYLDDGVTKKGGKNIFLNNPKGHFLFHREKADFLNYSLVKRLRMDYTFYCDFSNLLTKREIADNLKASILLIQLCGLVHNIKHLFDKKK